MRRLYVFLFLLVLAGCSEDMSDDPIPFIPFDEIVVDLTLPQYNALRTTGFVEIDGGVRGILIVKSGTSYIAYEKNCSFQPNDACATVEMHSSTLYILDPCCNSTFTPSTGEPASGPAFRPLRKYATSLSGNVLTITDEIV